MQSKKKRDNAIRDLEQAEKRAAEEAAGKVDEVVEDATPDNLLNGKDEDGESLQCVVLWGDTDALVRCSYLLGVDERSVMRDLLAFIGLRGRCSRFVCFCPRSFALLEAFGVWGVPQRAEKGFIR